MRRRDWLSTAAIVVLISVLVGYLANERLAGLSIDYLFWLRARFFAPAYTPAQSPTIVVALDEETYRRPPFTVVPKAMWTPQIAAVLDALIEGQGAVGHLDEEQDVNRFRSLAAVEIRAALQQHQVRLRL